jgi:hypothetical protein
VNQIDVDHYNTPTPIATGSSATVTETPNESSKTPTSSDVVLDELITQTPKVEETPAPKVEETPAPKAEETPPPKVEETPAPKAEGEVAFEIVLEENSPLTDADVDEIVAIAEDKGLTKEQTDKLIKSKEALYKRGEESLRAKALAQYEQTKKAFEADPLFSSPEKREESFQVIDIAVSKFGTPELKEALKGPLGNNLAIAKFLHNLGKSQEQDQMRGKGQAPSAHTNNSEEARAAALYPEFFTSSM